MGPPCNGKSKGEGCIVQCGEAALIVECCPKKLPKILCGIENRVEHNICLPFPPPGRVTAQRLVDTNKSDVSLSQNGAVGCT